MYDKNANTVVVIPMEPATNTITAAFDAPGEPTRTDVYLVTEPDQMAALMAQAEMSSGKPRPAELADLWPPTHRRGTQDVVKNAAAGMVNATRASTLALTWAERLILLEALESGRDDLDYANDVDYDDLIDRIRWVDIDGGWAIDLGDSLNINTDRDRWTTRTAGSRTGGR